jgi:hypothetical protein
MNTKNSPWGHIDSAKEVSRGIFWVSTSSHGGYYLSEEMHSKMPEQLRFENSYSGRGSQWFEEDLEWSLVVASFPECFEPKNCMYAVNAISYYKRKAKGEYFFEAAQWLNSPAGDALKSRAQLYHAESA